MPHMYEPTPPRLHQARHDALAAHAAKLRHVTREELNAIHGRVMLVHGLLGWLPAYAGGRIRALALRKIGFQIGRGTVVLGMPQFHGAGNIYPRLSIGSDCTVNLGCFFDLNGAITIGNHVGLGHEVMILTASHLLGSSERRIGPLTVAPVHIERGAWIGARSTILPGVTIGAGTVVAAGSVVHRNVPPNVLVAGVPAVVQKTYAR